MIFGLRVEPSITKNGVQMTNLLQTRFFQLIYGKINEKLREIIKKLKNNFLTRPVNFLKVLLT